MMRPAHEPLRLACIDVRRALPKAIEQDIFDERNAAAERFFGDGAKVGDMGALGDGAGQHIFERSTKEELHAPARKAMRERKGE
jgi:hypothetical protein